MKGSEMQMMKDSRISVTAYDWVPDFAQGQVRDLRLRWALEEAGFLYEVEHLQQGTQGNAANLARQPFGQVPVLTVDGTPMFESGAAVWRIAEASDTLLPDDPGARDACLSWIFGALNTIEPPLSMVVSLWFFERMPNNFGLSDGSAATTLRPAAQQQANTRLKQFAEALGDREYIVGERFTVADLMLTAVLLIADSMDLLNSHPSAKDYFKRHSNRPAFHKAQSDQVATCRKNAAIYEGVS